MDKDVAHLLFAAVLLLRQATDGLTHAELAAGSSGVQRLPVISDGRYLHIFAESDKARQTPPPPSRVHPAEVRDEDDESSEGGGQIGSTWDKMNFCIETFDPQDGMRHVRSVSIQGPVSDYGLQEGDGMLWCCVCGLVMRKGCCADWILRKLILSLRVELNRKTETGWFLDIKTGRLKLQPRIWPVSCTFFRNPLGSDLGIFLMIYRNFSNIKSQEYKNLVKNQGVLLFFLGDIHP